MTGRHKNYYRTLERGPGGANVSGACASTKAPKGGGDNTPRVSGHYLPPWATFYPKWWEKFAGLGLILAPQWERKTVAWRGEGNT